MLEITDDSGFLVLVVPATYQSFVDEDWDFEMLRTHFRQQMGRRSILIWGTGLEGIWRIDFRIDGPDIQGFREISGTLHVEGGSVLVTSYESLTMAAQYADVSLPQSHEQDHLIVLPDGDYTCRIVQMFDPNTSDSAGENSADFVVALSKSMGPESVWSEIPWFTAA